MVPATPSVSLAHQMRWTPEHVVSEIQLAHQNRQPGCLDTRFLHEVVSDAQLHLLGTMPTAINARGECRICDGIMGSHGIGSAKSVH